MKKAASYYMVNGDVYSPGAVFQHIVSMRYDMIIGLDFGHGESVVYKNVKDSKGEWSYDPLKCGSKGETEVPTYLSYEENHRVLIGEDATLDPDFIQYFKVVPAQWSMPADEAGHTFQDVIRDFIAELWNYVLTWDAGKTVKKALEGDRLLLAVGCPSSDKWTSADNRKKYIELIAKATGCKAEHIAILPESTAAIMVPVISGKGGEDSRRVDSGVAVYDLGSSTIDFTYVYLGKRLIVRSLYLGGSDIDKAMLRKDLKDNGVAQTSLSPQDVNKMCVNLRGLKEKFYRTGMSCGMQTHWISNDRRLDCKIDTEFMRAVLREDRDVQTRDPDYIGLSWRDCLEKFIKNTAALIASVPCDTVILTGGTSRVTDVSEICSAVYGADRLVQEENPAISVAKGLCYAKGLETRSAPLIDDAKLILKPRFDEAYEAALTKFAKKFFDISWDTSLKVVNDFLEKDKKSYPMKDFLEANERILKTPEKQAAFCSIFIEEFTTELIGRQEEIRNEVNKLSAAIYKTELKTPPLLPEVLQSDKRNEFLERIDLTGILKPERFETDSILGAAGGLAVMFFILNPELWPVLIGMIIAGYGFQELLNFIVNKVRGRDLSVRKLKKMQRWLANPAKKASDAQKKVPKFLESLKKELESSDVDEKPHQPTQRELFDSILNDQLEIAVGQILFLLYEEKPE